MNIHKWCKDYARQEFERLYSEQHPEESPPENPYDLRDHIVPFWQSLLFAFLDKLPYWCIVLGISILLLIALGVFK